MPVHLAALAFALWQHVAAPAVPALDGNRLVLPGSVTFSAGSDALSPIDQPALHSIQAFLAAKDSISLVRIEQHSDADGDPGLSQTLTQARALAVARWLVANGVDCKRVLPVGFGGMKPVAPNDLPENKAKNRRTEAHVAALRGRPIGGMPLDGGGVVAGDPCISNPPPRLPGTEK